MHLWYTHMCACVYRGVHLVMCVCAEVKGGY